jgi:hypothetical protein
VPPDSIALTLFPKFNSRWFPANAEESDHQTSDPYRIFGGLFRRVTSAHADTDAVRAPKSFNGNLGILDVPVPLGCRMNSSESIMICTMGASANQIYEAVLSLSRSIAGRTDLAGLLSGVRESLCRIVRFDHLG